jgi:diguanylate cyclase (GGDEF)-like protein
VWPRWRAAPANRAADPTQALFAREREDHARMWALLSTMDIGILYLSNEERVIYCNPAFLRIWRVPPGPGVIGAGVDELLAVTGCTLARPDEQSRYVLRAPGEGKPDVKLDLPLADGRLITQQSHEVMDAAGKRLGRMWVLEDVTADRRNAMELTQLAERDALTGLHNRHRFNEEITRMTADAQRNGSRVALFFFDLDGFKHINDTFGHRAGDATLIRVAKEVGAQVRRNEIFARLGGDEFAILAPDTPDDVLAVLAERITRSIADMRIDFEGQHMHVTCSCGIAVYPDHAADTERLIERADGAMYEAKQSGKNAWRLYRASGAPGLAISPGSPEGRVRRALEGGLLIPHLQGVFAPGGKTPHHYEVLLRVRDTQRADALLLPGELIALAEKSDTINEIDRFVLGEVVARLAREPAIPALAVNISGRSLDDTTLPLHIADLLQRHRVAAQRLKIELTETAAVSDLHDARKFIDALHHLGCGVSLDDFGTGFSSFAYLKHLHVDAIKIDGIFIRDLSADRQNQLFVQAIVSVARGLHKVTIAECVEDVATLNILTTLGVDYVQGFHLQKPFAGEIKISE